MILNKNKIRNMFIGMVCGAVARMAIDAIPDFYIKQGFFKQLTGQQEETEVLDLTEVLTMEQELVDMAFGC